jgi:hypothetical protein
LLSKAKFLKTNLKLKKAPTKCQNTPTSKER